MKIVVHIAPTLPPAVNGLGDFCKILADNLHNGGYVKNLFLIKHSPETNLQPDTYIFNRSNIAELLCDQRPDTILLHYVGYAYHKYALPFYLLSALRYCKTITGCRLVVFFHELYSSSHSPFKLPFYTSTLQQFIVKKLIMLSDKVFTNCAVYCGKLNAIARRMANPPDIECTGIFSNIPEALVSSQSAREQHSLVVFGSNARRNSVYNHQNFQKLIRHLEVTKIYDIGVGMIPLDMPVHIFRLGPLSPEELARFLNLSTYGLLCYKPELVGKSGIYSAFAAFGVLPINLIDGLAQEDDQLIEGVNYFNATCILRSSKPPEPFDHVQAWYRKRDQKTITAKVRSSL